MGVPISIAAGAPAPELAASVESAEIVERIGEPTTFKFRLAVVERDGDFPLLADAKLGPGSALTLAGWAADTPHVLVHGPIYAQQVHFQHGIAGSWVEVSGGDETLLMDRDVRAQVHGDGLVSDAVTSILGRYGFIAKVDSIDAQFRESEHSLIQRATDLRFLRTLARRYGRWFWLERTPVDTTIAHFEKPKTKGTAVAELAINAKGAQLAELDLTWDVERPTTGIAKQLGLRDKQTIDGSVARSSLPPLGLTPLADIAGNRAVQVIAPADSAGDLRARTDAALQEAAWFVRARGQTSVRALGKLLRPHTIVALGGVGKRHSGNDIVESVRHVLDASGHRMEFELMRNSWGAA